jgi:hypothetical protein
MYFIKKTRAKQLENLKSFLLNRKLRMRNNLNIMQNSTYCKNAIRLNDRAENSQALQNRTLIPCAKFHSNLSTNVDNAAMNSLT